MATLKNTQIHPERKKYWYFVSQEVCVLCGCEHIDKERRYDEKPEDPAKRYDYKEFACGEHFC